MNSIVLLPPYRPKFARRASGPRPQIFLALRSHALQLRVHRERLWIRIFPRVCRWGYVSGALSPIPRDEQVGFDAMPSPLREVAISHRAHCDAAGQNLDIAARATAG